MRRGGDRREEGEKGREGRRGEGRRGRRGRREGRGGGEKGGEGGGEEGEKGGGEKGGGGGGRERDQKGVGMKEVRTRIVRTSILWSWSPLLQLQQWKAEDEERNFSL